MPQGIKKGTPPPDEGMLTRATESAGRVPIAPGKDELKSYIKKRLAEGHLSVNRCAKAMGLARVALQNSLTQGFSVSDDFLSRMLYIVDGENCPYNIKRKSADDSPKDMDDIGGLLERHPDMEVDEWDADAWIIRENGREWRYPKRNYSLTGALNAFVRNVDKDNEL